MVKMTRGASPRRVGGGRSDRHESRHKAQGYTRTNAPEWSDAGARAAMEVLQGLSAECGTSIVQEARKTRAIGSQVSSNASRALCVCDSV